MVLHVNHPSELGSGARQAITLLRNAGIPLLSQTVLLKGVNDTFDTLAELFEALADGGVVPYYLHLLDPVAGAAHFHIPLEQARALHEELRRNLPGWCVPRLVREVPGEPCKSPA